MKYSLTILTLAFVFLLSACKNDKPEAEKGFQVSNDAENTENETSDGLNFDSLFITRPGSVLLTGIKDVRLTTIFKVNLNKKNNTTYIGSNSFHYNYLDNEENPGNNWNNSYMPGIEAVYGYNMVNISYYNITENKQKNFFEKPVLIKTLYYPSFTSDTLNYQAVKRNFFLVSAYNDDTNKDGFINLKDLRRFFLFDINGKKQKALVPENYSVFKSEYDYDNDFMFVFA